eukprot:gnl/TRDRNA2_/TRDRNA2_155119_c0_seq1.p1 gnl/TRDRNA2_/TRDRNA2_155119_c0~~gnl/TRDRNA2_/TRDRNA2_155119_c0_seq1.p1  ORF type:complete len:971 (-),score=124.72 gnl/TRDRNA2_/TRDRNA2_155119_c0_seq1:122-2848(-)
MQAAHPHAQRGDRMMLGGQTRQPPGQIRQQRNQAQSAGPALRWDVRSASPTAAPRVRPTTPLNVVGRATVPQYQRPRQTTASPIRNTNTVIGNHLISAAKHTSNVNAPRVPAAVDPPLSETEGEPDKDVRSNELGPAPAAADRFGKVGGAGARVRCFSEPQAVVSEAVKAAEAALLARRGFEAVKAAEAAIRARQSLEENLCRCQEDYLRLKGNNRYHTPRTSSSPSNRTAAATGALPRIASPLGRGPILANTPTNRASYSPSSSPASGSRPASPAAAAAALSRVPARRCTTSSPIRGMRTPPTPSSPLSPAAAAVASPKLPANRCWSRGEGTAAVPGTGAANPAGTPPVPGPPSPMGPGIARPPFMPAAPGSPARLASNAAAGLRPPRPEAAGFHQSPRMHAHSPNTPRQPLVALAEYGRSGSAPPRHGVSPPLAPTPRTSRAATPRTSRSPQVKAPAISGNAASRPESSPGRDSDAAKARKLNGAAAPPIPGRATPDNAPGPKQAAALAAADALACLQSAQKAINGSPRRASPLPGPSLQAPKLVEPSPRAPADTPTRMPQGVDASSPQALKPLEQRSKHFKFKLKTEQLQWLEDLLRAKKVKGSGLVSKHARQKSEGRCEGDINHEDITFHEPIGAGSFGAVWKGSVGGQVVAVKQCKVGDKHDADMLLLECRYLQKLRHKRLVSYLGCCNKPPHVVMLVEYMSGGSLYSLLFQKKRKLEFETRARMAMQVAEGMTYLHANSTVHRDLKTMNIVMDDQLNCKICDFGLTVTLEKSHLTVRALQGSPRYMAPEQFEAAARITEKVDIWQMGCVMLELFCNCIPFSSFTGVQQIATELLMKMRPPAIPISADARARVLIHACLRISPSLRPDALTLERALLGVYEDCVENAPIVARTDMDQPPMDTE